MNCKPIVSIPAKVASEPSRIDKSGWSSLIYIYESTKCEGTKEIEGRE